MSTPTFSAAGRTYLWSVIAVGVVIIGGSIYELVSRPVELQWFILAALTLVSGSATVKLPRTSASISISETFVFTAALLYGPAAASVIVALDALAISFWAFKRHDQLHRVLFNTSAPAISVWCSAQIFFLVSKISPLVVDPASSQIPLPALAVNTVLPALLVFALTYFMMNSWLVTFIIAIERHLNPLEVWANSFVWLSLNYFGGASLAILFVGYTRRIDLGYIGVIVPLLMVLYFTFKTTMGRVEDADRHVEQLNRLYLSTIETLAMAIDAKDQVTHGHIRRVQIYATNLAREIGVRDPLLIKAIEAAALLHDMGKLAVPEYILNKPGRLSEAEFEKMKLHASVGADILSAVEFPYPVVPIVRHHHENWDGTGYPDQVKGTDIPIGARILSVVDCFDALTSDRPYRPRLSDEEALRILMERRGTMYDPLIIDTFARVHRSIAPKATESRPAVEALKEIVSARKSLSAADATSPRLEEITASADEMLTLYELARGLAGQVSLNDAADVIAKHLRRLVPSSLIVFYIYRTGTDELEAAHAVGDGASLVRGSRIPLGQRLSGWVAANRQSICNSDPTLDFGEVARSKALGLRSCLSTPLLSDNVLVGVVSLYSGHAGAFSEDHRRIIELVAGQIADTFKRSIEFDEVPRRDSLTGLPRLDQLEELIRPLQNLGSASYAVLLIDIVQMKGINQRYGRAVGDEILRQVVDSIRRGLRVADILFRNTSDEFVVFLNATDRDTADAVAARIRENIRTHPPFVMDETLPVDVTVVAVCAPGDGTSLTDLIKTAKTRTTTKGEADPTVH